MGVLLREAQLVDLLGGDDPLAAGHRGGEAVEHRGLAGLRAAGHQDVEAGLDRALEERCRLGGEAAQLDQVAQPRGAQDELADVDRREAAADPLEHHVQAVALGQHRVDERAGQVDATTRGLEHPLDQLGDLRRREHQVGELVAAGAGDEDAAGVVDPDLLDRRVVEERLEGAEAAHPRDQLAHDAVDVGDRSHRAGQGAVVVVAHDALGQPTHDGHVALRVDALAPDQLADDAVELVEQLVVGAAAGVRGGAVRPRRAGRRGGSRGHGRGHRTGRHGHSVPR